MSNVLLKSERVASTALPSALHSLQLNTTSFAHIPPSTNPRSLFLSRSIADSHGFLAAHCPFKHSQVPCHCHNCCSSCFSRQLLCPCHLQEQSAAYPSCAMVLMAHHSSCAPQSWQPPSSVLPCSPPSSCLTPVVRRRCFHGADPAGNPRGDAEGMMAMRLPMGTPSQMLPR